MDMSDFFGDSSTAVAVAAALPLHNGGLYPTGPAGSQGNSMSNVEFSDLSHEVMGGGVGGGGGRNALLNHGLHPMSNASLGSRGSEEDVDEVSAVTKSQGMSELGKAFNVMNDDFHYN